MWHHVHAEIEKDVTVMVKGVKGTPQDALNGTVGVAKDQNEDKSRWNVEFEGKDGGEPTTVALKPDNLENADPTLVPCPRGDKCNDLTARCGRDRHPSSICSSGSRVHLSDGAYINANYIRYPDYVLRRSGRLEEQDQGDVIATQGPLSGIEGDETVKGKKVKGKQQPDKFVKGKYKWPDKHAVPSEFAKDDWEFKNTQPQFWQMVRRE